LFILNSSRRQWDPAFKVGKLLETLSPTVDIVQNRFGCNNVLVSDRDFVLCRLWHKLESGEWVYLMVSVDHPAAPPTKGVIRGHLDMAGYCVSPSNTNPECVEVTYVNQVHCRGCNASTSDRPLLIHRLRTVIEPKWESKG